MLRAVANSVLLKIGDIWLKKPSAIVNESAAYAHGSDLNAADLVQIVGEVISIPKTITTKRLGYEGFSADNIKVGDTAIFRYDVVYSFRKNPDGFKNLFYYKGKEYWAADIQKIFAVIRNGEIIMLNGYCMVEEIREKPNIILPAHLQDYDGVTWATLTHIGENLKGNPKINAHVGDRVYFSPNYLQTYEINGNKFGIVQQKHIYASDITTFNALHVV